MFFFLVMIAVGPHARVSLVLVAIYVSSLGTGALPYLTFPGDYCSGYNLTRPPPWDALSHSNVIFLIPPHEVGRSHSPSQIATMATDPPSPPRHHRTTRTILGLTPAQCHREVVPRRWRASCTSGPSSWWRKGRPARNSFGQITRKNPRVLSQP